MINTPPCVCGHAIEEHGHDPDYPGSTSCAECDCVAYEADDDLQPEPEQGGEKGQ